MDSLSAMMMGERNRDKPMMVFDWDRAAQLILEHGASEASAVLRSDWEYTGGSIFANGAPVSKEHTYTFLASTWATPELEIDGERVACFKMQADTPEWDAHTYWPESAKEILAAKAAN